MSHVYGEAGKSAQAMGDGRYRNLILRNVLPMIGLLSLLWIGAEIISAGHFLLGAAFFVSVVFAIKILEKRGYSIKERIFHADTGAKAEVDVADELVKLPDSYHVFHDLTFPGFNIDHVVLGPTGIFLIETKSQKGTITQRDGTVLRNGRKFFKDFVDQCLSQVYALKEYLRQAGFNEQFITPILCFSRGFVKVRGPVRHVYVHEINYLLGFITSRQICISPDVIDSMAHCLAKATYSSIAHSVHTSKSSDAPSLCPKCGYMRSQVDDLYFKETECPQCEVIYTQATSQEVPGSLNLAKPSWKLGNLLMSRSVLHAGSIILASALVLGLFASLINNLGEVFTNPVSQQINSAPHSVQPKAPVSSSSQSSQLLANSGNFPLSHAVAFQEAEPPVAFTFVEDRGQNVVLLFVDADTSQLVIRACVRANEKLRTVLPQADLGLMMVTGPHWYDTELHFDDQADARKAVIYLKSSTNIGKGKSYNITASSFFADGQESSPDEFKGWLQRAFKKTGFAQM